MRLLSGRAKDQDLAAIPREREVALIVAAEDLRPELVDTILARRDIERIHAPTPEAGFDMARASRPKLVIIDGATHAEAVTLVRRLRRDPLTRPAGVVVLSPSTTLVEEQALRQAGANAILAGRLDPQVWEARLEELLEVPRRREARIPVRLETWSRADAGQGAIAGLALNISVHGILLETAEPLAVGMKLDISFVLPGSPVELRALGQVARNAGLVEGRPRSGVRFLVLRGDSYERIRKFVGAATPFAPHTRRSGPPPEASEPLAWEAELRASEARNHAILESVFDCIVTLDHEGRIVEYNRAAEQTFGYARAEVLGRQVVEVLVPPALRERHHRWMARCLATGECPMLGRRIETTGVRADGSEFPMELALAPVALERGWLFTACLRDITDRRRFEESLRASGRQFRALFDGAMDAMVIAEDEGRCVEVNRAACRLHRVGREDLLGSWIGDWAAPGFDFQQAWRGLRSRPEVRGELRLVGADGGARELEFAATADFLPGSHLVVLRDVTEQRQLELQLRQAQKMEAVGRLAGGVAHDFNNLLNVITGYGELLLRQLPPEGPPRHKAHEILKAAERAAGLTRQLLAFSRKQVLQPRVFELNAVVADLEKMLRRLLGEDIELITDLEPGLGRIKADPGQIEQVLMNLVVNAREAMPQGGRILIETRNMDLDAAFAREHLGARLGPCVRLRVRDTGLGMDADTQRRIFEPFFTTKEQGTGLGLATVYGIVKQSDGHIWLESLPGHGTSFEIYLPRVEPTAEGAPAGVSVPATCGGAETILLVEDQSPLREMVREVLEAGGYRVLEAASGAEAVELAQAHSGPIHLVLTDVVMPGMAGTALARRLVASRPDTKVLYMSGHTDQTLVGTLEPGTAFLQKPFTPSLLERRLREVLDGPCPR